VPDYQRRHIKRTQRFDLLEPVKSYRIYSEALAKIGKKAVMLFRPAMTPDVEKAGL
jgi:ribonuclease J